MKQYKFKNSEQKKISHLNLLMISFAAIFGSGWLFAPLYAAQLAGSNSVLAWCLGAAMAAIIGLTMAEVTVLFPKSGGLNQIAQITHGDSLALLITVLNLLVFVVLPTLEVRAVIQYLDSHFHFFLEGDGSVAWAGYLVAFVLLSLITLINLYGSALMTFLNNIMVCFKIITPILVCVAFIYATSSFSGRIENRFSLFFPIRWEGVFQAIATSGIIFSFNGFSQAIIFAGEAQNPKKAIPFAILGSLFFSAALYLLLQFVFIISVPEASLAQGWDKLSFSGDQGPFAGVALFLGLHWIVKLIYADAVISPMGTAFTYASSAPRLLSQLACDYTTFPQIFRVNRHGISTFSVILILLLEMATFLFLPTLKSMISILVAAFVLCYTVAPVSLLILRKTHPELVRPFRVSSAPLVCFLSIFFSHLMVFSCGWIAVRNLMIASGGIVLLFLIFSQSTRTHLKGGLLGSTWFLFQLICLVGICYMHEFDGVSFLVSVLAIAYMSGVTLVMAKKIRPVN